MARLARAWVYLMCLAAIAAPPCWAQPVPTARLPQDAAREPQPAARNAALLIDRDRYAEQVPAGADALRFRLEGIDLSGNVSLPSSRFEGLWADLMGREVTLAQVFDIAARISAIYRDAGYVLSQALVPQQAITQAGGQVRIRVAEGYVARISVSPGVRGADRMARLLAPIRNERPLTLATLERYLLLLGDLPGVRSQAVLRAGSEANAADLELVVERDLQGFSAAVHNRTSAAVGPLRWEASAERRGLFREFDRHALRWIGAGSERLNLLAYNGDAPVGLQGASLIWSASASRSRPKSGELFQFNTRSDNASLGLAYPLLRSRAANLSLRGSLAAYNGRSDIGDGLPVSQERLRSLRLGASADLTDAMGGVNLLDLEIARGLSGLGASRRGDPLLARAGLNPQFTKATLYAARLQSLGGEWSLLAAVSAQHSDDLLSSAEQFGLGGDAFLRAFDPSELLGDRGAAAKLELRYNTLLGPVGATVYAYGDTGSVQQRAIDAAATRQSASAVGLGLRFSGSQGLRGYVEVAKPIHRDTVRHGDRRARGFAGLGIDF